MTNVSGQLHLVNAVGMRLSVDVESEQDAFTKMRALGRGGWGPLEVPAGGFRLPLALHEKFDWSLIGAFALEIDGEHGVMFQGHFYKQRVFEEQTKGKKLPASVKYSRGAKPTDPPHIVEGDEKSSFKYVTLITFRGNGKSIAQLEIPTTRTLPARLPNGETREIPVDPPPHSGAPVEQRRDEHQPGDVLQTHIGKIGEIIQQRGFRDVDVKRLVREITHGKTNDYTKIAVISEAAQVRTRLANARQAS